MLMVLLQFFLILLNAVFACAEIAVISMNDNKLAKRAAEGDKRAIRLVALTSQPARFLATIQVAITLSGFMGSAFAAENFSDSLVDWLIGLGLTAPVATLDAISVVVITLILAYFTLIFGELVPKRLAMRKAEVLALGMSALMSSLSKLFAPIVWFLTLSTNAVLGLLGIGSEDEEEAVSEEEIRMMVDMGTKTGTIDDEEKQLIHNVFAFDDLTAGQIATHRTDIALLWREEDVEAWKETIYSTRHSLYPICEDSVDNIVGILNAKDYLRRDIKDKEAILQYSVKGAYFVPQTVKADVLFSNMKQTQNTMAVVLDEYGGMVGIVTINDLVEQLVGELACEVGEQQRRSKIEKISELSWRISGDTPLEKIEQALGVQLPEAQYDTLNGLVFDTLGAIPSDGDVVELDVCALNIKVETIREHQVEAAIVTLKEVRTNGEGTTHSANKPD